jgi:hypothetical protein
MAAVDHAEAMKEDAQEMGPPMTADERVDYIYQELSAVSPFVRKSMLVYNCIPSNYLETDPRTQQPMARRVLWMATNHPFFPVAKRLIEQHHPLGVIHRSTLAGIPMRGVDADVVELVVGLVWGSFLCNTERYPVWDEDGTPLSSNRGRNDDLPPTEEEPSSQPETCDLPDSPPTPSPPVEEVIIVEAPRSRMKRVPPPPSSVVPSTDDHHPKKE